MDRTAQNVVPISAKRVAFGSYSWALVREAHKVSRERWAGLGQWVGEIAGVLALLNAFGVVAWLQNWAGGPLAEAIRRFSAVLEEYRQCGAWVNRCALDMPDCTDGEHGSYEGWGQLNAPFYEKFEDLKNRKAFKGRLTQDFWPDVTTFFLGFEQNIFKRGVRVLNLTRHAAINELLRPMPQETDSEARPSSESAPLGPGE